MNTNEQNQARVFMKNCLVIEGDNGTGKDTLARALHLPVVNYYDEIHRDELQAKSQKGYDRIRSFLAYNQKCAEKAENMESAIIVRYWPSTLAGAFADRLISEQELLNEIELCDALPKPKLLVLLRCQYETRIQRILARNVNSNGTLHDNIQKDRSERHWYAMQRILKQFPRYLIWDNTNLTSIESQKLFLSYIKNQII